MFVIPNGRRLVRYEEISYSSPNRPDDAIHAREERDEQSLYCHSRAYSHFQIHFGRPTYQGVSDA
jgi:hypothetical protein